MSAADILSWAGTVGFVALGLASIVNWARSRARVTLYLALALALLGAVSLTGRINELTDYRNHIYTDVGVVGFLASGYFLLLFRHEFLPLSRRVLWAMGGLVVATSILGVIAELPSGDAPLDYTTLQTVAITMLVALWAACVGEPVIRFWAGSRHKPAVQRSRLRALSAAYGGIILLLFFSVAAQPEPDSPTSIGLNLFTLVLVPLLYVSFAPPRWLRRAWHEREEDTLGLAQGLAVFAPDRKTIAQRALERGLRLVGADAGYIRDVGGELLAVIDLSDDAVEEIERRRAEIGGHGSISPMEGVQHTLVLPLDTGEDGAIMAVVSGPFTPLFGSDEISRLQEYSEIVSVALDRVRLVEALADETDRYQALLQAISDVGEGFVITENGRCVYANEAYVKLTGYSLRELRSLASLVELAEPADREMLSARLRERIAGGAVSDHYESSLVRKDGTLRSVEVAVKLLKTEEGPRIISLVRDITERKIAEQTLTNQTQAIRLLQEIAIAANEAHELEEALAVALREICRYSGWPVGHVYLPSAEIIGQLVPTGIWHLDDPERFEEFRRITEDTTMVEGVGLPGRVLETGRPVWISDVRADPGFRRASANMAIRAGFAFPVLVGREVAGVLEFFTDEIAEPDDGLLDVVTNIGTQLGRVIERQRIASLRSEFISNAAHELRTPITAIVGFSSLLAEDTGLSESESKSAVEALHRQAERLKTLVNNLLDFTRMQERRLEVDLTPLRVVDAMQNAVEAVPIPKEKTVEVTGDEQLMAMADKLQLEQILTNLIVNAVRYGGNQIHLSVEEDGRDRLTLAVSDNGPGVPKELTGRLFEPFSRGPRSGSLGGTGLGLAIVRMLVHAQGGDVLHRSPPRGGSRFEVHLKRA